MNKIVFVNSPPPSQEKNDLWENAGPKTPPLGLLNLAAVTRNEGYETKIIDAEAFGLDIKETVKRVLNLSPNYVGLTATTIFIKNAARIAKGIKEKSPDTKVIIGGAHLTALPDKTMKDYPSFDIGVIGEGEITLIELLNSFDNKNLNKVDGIIFRKGKKLVKTKKRALIKNLDSLPMPAWDLLPKLSKHYRTYAQSADKFPSFSIITSRGCIGQCIFCDRAIFGNYCRAHSAEYVFEMMKKLHCDYGIKNIIFEDDLFTLFKSRVYKLVDLLKGAKLKISWSVCSRVDTVNLDLLNKMKEGGCWQILYGIESGSQRVLDFIKKGITIKQINDALELTKKAGLSTKGFFIFGHPTETEESIQQTVNLIKKSKLDDFSSSFFTPFPGSEVYSSINKYGKFEEDWEKMNAYEPVFVPEGFTKDKLYHHSKKAYQQFYLRPRVIFNYIQRFKNPKQIKTLVRAGFGFLKYMLKR